MDISGGNLRLGEECMRMRMCKLIVEVAKYLLRFNSIYSTYMSNCLTLLAVHNNWVHFKTSDKSNL